ncbi:MAG: hypothetical protein QXJ20_01110 [Candidatus Aenigmatarchaeota archaeon]
MAPILIVLCILAFIFWFLGRTTRFKEAEALGVSIICGIMIALDIMIVLASFDVYPGFNKPFLIGWLVSIFFLIGFYQSGGPPIIYTFTVLCIIFGYLFTGPYSGYMKHYLEQVKAPIRVVYRMFGLSFHDLSLMLTNPQQYIQEQQMKAVKTEAQQTQPKGVELSSVMFSPPEVPLYQKFFVEVRVENLGNMKAENITLNVTCIKKKCEESYNYTIDKLERLEGFVQRLGPFIAKEEKPGAQVDLNITLRSEYSAKSSLIVEVMNEEEIRRIMLDPIKRYELFRSVVATGTPSPAMLALSVGEQPLFNSSTQVLTVSVVNKRIGEYEYIILKKGSKINITLPNTIGSGLNCSAIGINCGNAEKKENKEVVSCEVEQEIRIPPMEFNKHPIVCEFTSSNITPEQIKRSDVITAELSGYIFEIQVKKGPTIMLTSVCAKEGEKCDKLRCCGVLQCCEDKVCRTKCEKREEKKEEISKEEKTSEEKPIEETLALGDEKYCEWKKSKYPENPDKWCIEGEGNCKEDECSTSIRHEGSGAELKCRSGIKGRVLIEGIEKEVELNINLCCFEDQDSQSCLENYIRKGGKI